MADNKLYSKKEISKILKRASEIQTQKDLYGDQEGLSESELLQLASEVGIDKDSLLEALNDHDSPVFDQEFKWLNATSRIQNINTVPGEVTDENWEELIQEIRRITGGIGKVTKVGNTYEWEQRRRELGYKHISLTPQNGNTKLQMVSGWGGMKPIVYMASFMVPLALGSIIMGAMGIPKGLSLLISAGAGIIGTGLGRVFLKFHFEKQKRMLFDLARGITSRLKSFDGKGKISIEEKEVYSESENTSSLSSKLKS